MLTEVVLALALLLLKLEGDTANGSLLDTLHQVGGETSDLVAKTLRGDDGDLIADLLVGVEVESKTRVVLLDHNARSTLDGLGANASPANIQRRSGQGEGERWEDCRGTGSAKVHDSPPVCWC